MPMAETPDDLMRLAERYRTFAVDEARGISPIYERLTHQIASAPDILRFLVSLPAPRRQPNLLLGAATFIAKRPPDIALLTGLVRDREAELRATMMARTTQTNEPARCAVLLPLLAALPEPLALIEVGASAGLCLLPDRYGYDYGDAALPGAPVLRCRSRGSGKLPDHKPEVAWRAGLDLNPVDLNDPAEVAWLEALV